MKQLFAVFGTHPDLSLAELLSVEPNLDDLRLAGPKTVIFTPQALDAGGLMGRLGGTVKVGHVVLDTTLDALDLKRVADLIASRSTQGKKIQFGWTVFASNQNKKLENFPLKLKKSLKELGLPSRWVTGENGQELSPAAVAKCKLTQEPNADICVFQIKDRVMIGLTDYAQDADAWSLRDYGRPFRDDENGMLPPKLARMLANLSRARDGAVIMDPFCGSGTVLMEAALALNAKKIIGSDINEKLVEDAKKNLEWLASKNIIDQDTVEKIQIIKSDARKISEQVEANSIDAIVTEGTLGPALRGREPRAQIQKNAQQIRELWKESLLEFKKILKPSGLAVIIIPGFNVQGFLHKVSLDDYLTEIGFKVLNPLESWGKYDLSYSRPNQFITRHILVLGLK